MLAIRAPRGSAEDLRKYLKRKGLLSGKYRVLGKNEFIYFPVSSEKSDALVKKAKELGAEFTDADFKLQHPERERRPAMGYELYGSIAVMEAEKEEAKKLAKGFMLANKRIETVLKKGGAVSGKYRTRKFVYVAGKKNYIANYKENGCAFVFDIRKVFFSTKLGYERNRIAHMARDGEKAIVMFAGVGPFAIEIAKLNKKSRIVAIELNSYACKYMRENVELNKTPNVAVECGDAQKLSEKYRGFADRIVMPLPKEAANFLPSALKMGKKKCAMHYYTFCETDKVKQEIAKISASCKENGKKFKLLGWRTVRPYSAREIEIVVDFIAC